MMLLRASRAMLANVAQASIGNLRRCLLGAGAVYLSLRISALYDRRNSLGLCPHLLQLLSLRPFLPFALSRPGLHIANAGREREGG